MTAPDDRAREAIDHLQAAGLELIAAARAFLDVAEDLVRDPATAGTVVKTVSALADLVVTPRPPTGAAGDRAATDRAAPAPTDSAVEHIRLS